MSWRRVDIDHQGEQIPYQGHFETITMTFTGDFGSNPSRDSALAIFEGFYGKVPFKQDLGTSMEDHFRRKLVSFEKTDSEPGQSVWVAKTEDPYCD